MSDDRAVPPAPRPRAVLLVANTAAPYSRGLRVARSLAEAGWDVEIAAVAGGDEPLEERDGAIHTRRYVPSGRLRRWVGQPPPPSPPTKLLQVLALNADKALKVVLWPIHVRAWWRTLRRELPPADLYHAFGILTLSVAVDLARQARQAGRRRLVVYDVIDAILDSNNYRYVPGPILARYRRREAAWVRGADAVVTVNEALADHCHQRWPFRERPTVLLNCQPRWTPPSPRPDLVREATGLPSERRIVLFLGKLGRERGLEMAAEAVVRLRDAALVMIGATVNRQWASALAAKSREPRLVGRHVVLPPVHPDDVRAWAASADVSIIAVAANSLNQRLSTPNKFWESLAAGTPVVIGRDLEVMRGIAEPVRSGRPGASPPRRHRAARRRVRGDAEPLPRRDPRPLQLGDRRDAVPGARGEPRLVGGPVSPLSGRLSGVGGRGRSCSTVRPRWPA